MKFSRKQNISLATAIIGLAICSQSSAAEAKSINAYIRDALGADLRLSDFKNSNNFDSIHSQLAKTTGLVESYYMSGKLTQTQYTDLRNKLNEIAARETAYETAGKISSKNRLKQLARLYDVELKARKGSSNKISGFLNKIAGL
ncbi:MAG: hypothetical protein K2X27_25595 [Candidatus Obscuribacterales bacterium]|nr:hypothetical protein [Candidatus Obscuribacterales bacterium]